MTGANRKSPKRKARNARRILPPSSTKRSDERNLDLETIWRKTRQGSRNVAGVRYQASVATSILVSGTLGGERIDRITPEGLEDIDCLLTNGDVVLVQAKDRAGGEGIFSLADVRDAVVHAVDAVQAYGGPKKARVAIATDAQFGQGLRATGWDGDLLSTHGSEIVDKLYGSFTDDTTRPERQLFERVSLINLAWNLADETIHQLARLRDVEPTVALLAYALLVDEIHRSSAAQRHLLWSQRRIRRPSDLDSIVQGILETVDVSSLGSAVRKGIIRPTDFVSDDHLSIDRFLAGVDVRPSHIAAGLDLPRPRELTQILNAIQEDRIALIVGPSGSGKSALLWRAARELRGPVRVFQVLSLTPSDVPDLVRFARLQRPSPTIPVLICADDLGRSHMSGWERAVDQLLEIDGVLLLGAARHEDFTPGLARGRAQLIEPRLDWELAAAIGTTLAQRQVRLHLDPVEAYEKSGNLLMEYLNLLLQGRRLEDIVGAQVEERFAPDRATEREVLRNICAAHVLGLTLRADALPALLNQPLDLHAALVRLRNEHVLTVDERQRWAGLHELRSAVATRRLHAVPPPTEGATYADLLRHVDAKDRRLLIGRTARRIDMNIQPLAETAAELISNGRVDLNSVADVVRGLAEADAVRYAHEAIAVAAGAGLDTVDPYDVLFVAIGIREHGIDFETIRAPLLKRVARSLPSRSHSLVETGIRALSSARMLEMIQQGTPTEALELLELSDQRMQLTRDDAAVIWTNLAPNLASSQITRLVASLYNSSHLTDAEVSTMFGAIDQRLMIWARNHENVIDWSVATADDGLVISVQVLSPENEEQVHSQAVETCRMILDLCPEADIAELTTVLPDGQPIPQDSIERGYKRIPRTNLPRNASVEWNKYPLDAVRLLLTDNSWTSYLGVLLQNASSVLSLLSDLPQRLLHPHDTASRRREWGEAIANCQKSIAVMLRPPLIGGSEATKDPAKSGLTTIAAELRGISRDLGNIDTSDLTRSATQLRSALKDLVSARELAYPRLAAVGTPLPAELDETLEALSDLLFVLGSTPRNDWPSRVSKDESWRGAVRRIVETARTNDIDRERRILTEFVSTLGPDVEVSLVPRADLSHPALVTNPWLVICPIERWEDMLSLLQASHGDLQALSLRLFAAPRSGGIVISTLAQQLGLTAFRTTPENIVADLAEAAGMQRLTSPTVQTIRRLLEVAASASGAWRLSRLRRPDLAAGATLEHVSNHLTEGHRLLGELPEGEMRVAGTTLLDRVEAEGTNAAFWSLAHDLATARRTGTPTEGVMLFGQLLIAATEYDLSRQSSVA